MLSLIVCVVCQVPLLEVQPQIVDYRGQWVYSYVYTYTYPEGTQPLPAWLNGIELSYSKQPLLYRVDNMGVEWILLRPGTKLYERRLVCNKWYVFRRPIYVVRGLPSWMRSR